MKSETIINKYLTLSFHLWRHRYTNSSKYISCALQIKMHFLKKIPYALGLVFGTSFAIWKKYCTRIFRIGWVSAGWGRYKHFKHVTICVMTKSEVTASDENQIIRLLFSFAMSVPNTTVHKSKIYVTNL